MELPSRLAHLSDPRVRRFAAYWLGKRDGRPMPALRHIDPTEIPWALPNVWICDCLPGSREFRYRLAGEDIRAVLGVPIRGRMVQEIVPEESYPTVLARYRRVVEEPAIAHNIGPVYVEHDRAIPGERIILPLGPSDPAEGDRTGVAILGYTVYHTDRTQEIRLPADRHLPTTFVPLDALTAP